MRKSIWPLLVIVAMLPAFVSALSGSAAEPDSATTLEVKLVGVTECAVGWELVSVDRGYTIYYPHPSGAMIRQWTDEATMRAAFTMPNGRVVTDALDTASRSLRSQPRAICRWAPLTVGGGAAD